MSFKPLIFLTSFCTLTINSLGIVTLNLISVSKTSLISQLESSLFLKFNEAIEKLWKTLQKEILEEIYKTQGNNQSSTSSQGSSSTQTSNLCCKENSGEEPKLECKATQPQESTIVCPKDVHPCTAQIPKDFFIKKSVNGDSQKQKREAKSITENSEDNINCLFLELVDDNVPSFLSSYSRYQSDISNTRSKLSPKIVRDQFYSQALFFLHSSLEAFKKLWTELSNYANNNPSSQQPKDNKNFSLNKKYFEFLIDFFKFSKEIFELIKEINKYSSILLSDNSFKDSFFFLSLETSSFDPYDTISKIETLIKEISFDENKNKIEGKYSEFTFVNPISTSDNKKNKK